MPNLKTKHGRACEETCSPGLSRVRELYPHLPGRAQAGEGLHVLLLGPELGGGLGREDWAEGVRDRGLLHLRRHEGTPTVQRVDREQLVRATETCVHIFISVVLVFNLSPSYMRYENLNNFL